MAKQSDDDRFSDFDEDFSRQLNGTLSFLNDDNFLTAADLRQTATLQDFLIAEVSNFTNNVRLKFEITETHVEDNGKSKFVVYGVVVSRLDIDDRCPICINRRYSNFEQLHSRLRKRFSYVDNLVSFPKKILVGNFKSRTIADRSRRFEQFLQSLSQLNETRLCSELADFFYGDKVRQAHKLLTVGDASRALPVLQQLWLLSQKIVGYCRVETIAALVALIAVSFTLEQLDLSQSYVEAALHVIDMPAHAHYTKPLLHFGIRLYWTLGKDKCDLERRLQQLEGSAVVKDLHSSPCQLLLSLAVDDLAQFVVK